VELDRVIVSGGVDHYIDLRNVHDCVQL